MNSPCPFATIPGFVAPTSFAFDELHTLGYGISKQLVSLMEGGKRQNKDYTKGDLYIGEKETMALFTAMEQSRSTIPSVFTGSFRRPHGKYTTRAVDWLDISRFVIPSLFVPACPNRDAQDALLAIVSVIQIALQPSINNELLQLMER